MRYALIAFLISVSLQLLANVENLHTVPYWVSFTDLDQYYANKLTPEQISALSKLSENAKQLIQSDQYDIMRLQLEKNYGILTLVLKSKNINSKGISNEIFIQQYQIDQRLNLQLISIKSISEMQFTAKQGVLQLKLLISSTDGTVSFLMPTSGPAIDFGTSPRSKGRTIFVSPLVQAVLTQKDAIWSRNDHPYYKGKPFIRIMPPHKNSSKFGFHISPWTEKLERGFVSAGCTRLEEADLYLLYYIVTKSIPTKIEDKTGLPISIDYQMEETEEHPYPKMERYQRLTKWNFSSGKFNTDWVENSAPPLDEALQQIRRIHEFWD